MISSEEYNKRQRAYRRQNNNAGTKKYEKTKKGFLMRLYRNMKSRVTGVQKVKAHLYQGKELLDKQDFYDWAMGSGAFHGLWSIWEAKGRERRYTPSVDRMDSSVGYVTSNMEWVPFHENCRRGGAVKKSQMVGA